MLQKWIINILGLILFHQWKTLNFYIHR